VILSRHHSHPFREVAVIGPDARPYYAPDPPTTSGRLRFILRSTLPSLPARTLSTTDDLLALPAPSGPRLVILIATDQRLSNSVQGRLNLEAIFPSTSSLDAFATSHTPARRP
jgi:hypothetical protein